MNAVTATAWVSPQTWQTSLSNLSDVHWTYASSIDGLKGCVDREGSCLALELGHRGHPHVELHQLVGRLQESLDLRLLLLIPPDPTALHEIMAYRMLDNQELFVLGGDPLTELPNVLRSMSARPAKDPFVNRLRHLPDKLGDVMLAAAKRPAAWPLKRILAEGGTSRSTLERRLDELGLPTPAVLLRQLAEAAQKRDQQSA